MAHVTVKGLVIRETDFGDADRYLTVLTAELGKIEIFCRGLRRRKGRLAGAARLFCYSEFTLFSGRQYTLNDAELDTPFWGITSNIEQYALCCYFAELAGWAAETDTTSELLPLFLRALYALDRQKRPVQVVKPAFELRLAAELGYAPDLGGCAVCGGGGAETAWSFLLENGALVCRDCRTRLGGTYFDTPPGVLAAMRYILTCEGRRLFAFSVGSETARQLGAICERYLLYHLDVHCGTLDFYHSLFPEEGQV